MATLRHAAMTQKVIEVNQRIAAGQSLSAACKAASLSTAAFKKWSAAFQTQTPPRWVIASSSKGAFSLAHDGKTVLVAHEHSAGVTLEQRGTEHGEVRLTAALDAPRSPHSWRAVVHLQGDAAQQRALMVLSGGAVLSWDLVNNTLSAAAPWFAERVWSPDTLCSSGPRRWPAWALSPDLETLVHWAPPTEGDRPDTLVVRQMRDGAERGRFVLGPVFISHPMAFHPAGRRFATLDDNKRVVVLDLETLKVLVDKGPQAHAVSFCDEHTVLYDSWYAKTHRFDFIQKTDSLCYQSWGTQASLGAHWLSLDNHAINVIDAKTRQGGRGTPWDELKLTEINPEGTVVAALTEHLAVWHAADFFKE